MKTHQISLVDPAVHDLGGFSVRRVLPHALARHVGPFVFFDHVGPAQFSPGAGIDVRPHPHIGLATVTYLFDGAIEHRDSLDSTQTIRPGDVNWMTSGRGIVHSERTPAAERAAGHALHGIQVWVALPDDAQETDPEFHHHPAASVPFIERDGVAMHLVVGNAFGVQSPVRIFSPMFYLAARFAQGASVRLPTEHPERAVYAVDAPLTIGTQTLDAGHLAVLPPGEEIEISADQPARAILFGGTSVGERHVWWNFVSNSRERIERAKIDWGNARFGKVPGDDEFIPLPER